MQTVEFNEKTVKEIKWFTDQTTKITVVIDSGEKLLFLIADDKLVTDIKLTHFKLELIHFFFGI